jgi:hypothetical protein
LVVVENESKLRMPKLEKVPPSVVFCSTPPPARRLPAAVISQ